jgi:pSer/pThr/pTyr-binding forkhead associated (FHA) protein
MDVSRRHCEFLIEAPLVRVRDLGSLNGTFVNGEKIGQRSGRLPPTEVDLVEFPACELRDGDEVQVGPNVIRVRICVAAEGWLPTAAPLLFV